MLLKQLPNLEILCLPGRFLYAKIYDQLSTFSDLFYAGIKCLKKPGMRIRIRSDPGIFGPPDPDPVIFRTVNNGFIKLFLS